MVSAPSVLIYTPARTSRKNRSRIQYISINGSGYEYLSAMLVGSSPWISLTLARKTGYGSELLEAKSNIFQKPDPNLCLQYWFDQRHMLIILWPEKLDTNPGFQEPDQIFLTTESGYESLSAILIGSAPCFSFRSRIQYKKTRIRIRKSPSNVGWIHAMSSS